jgi:hypothetical protein
VIYCNGGEAIKRALTGSVHGVGKTSTVTRNRCFNTCRVSSLVRYRQMGAIQSLPSGVRDIRRWSYQGIKGVSNKLLLGVTSPQGKQVTL